MTLIVQQTPNEFLDAVIESARRNVRLRTWGEMVLFCVERLEASGQVVELRPNRGPIIDLLTRRAVEERYGLPIDAPGMEWCVSMILEIMARLEAPMPSGRRWPRRGYWEGREANFFFRATIRDGTHLGHTMHELLRPGDIVFTGPRDSDRVNHGEVFRQGVWLEGRHQLYCLGGNVRNRIGHTTHIGGDPRVKGFFRIPGRPPRLRA